MHGGDVHRTSADVRGEPAHGTEPKLQGRAMDVTGGQGHGGPYTERQGKCAEWPLMDRGDMCAAGPYTELEGSPWWGLARNEGGGARRGSARNGGIRARRGRARINKVGARRAEH